MPHLVDDSPVGQRRQLGAAMRSFRKEAGIDRDEAAELIEATGPTLTRKERGESKFKRQEIEVLARAYDIGRDDLSMLLELAREVRAGTRRGEFPMFVPLKSRAFLELERAEAVEVLAVTLTLVPLYFQTEAYMRELWLRSGDLLAPERIEELVALRKARQQVLAKRNPPTIRAVVHELALRLPVGGPTVMHEQLLHLAAACDLPNVEIQVQPISAGAYPGMDAAFYLLRFRNGPTADLVQVHGHAESFYRDRETATEPYRVAWDRRKVAALDLRASKALILEAATRFEVATGS
ncbi:helix-turn-helix transcriptional regulator [Saccharothrix longispora]|uniref:helix-turn-helix domain-containing protein n=1 Tax=Saccharothrix longispora TaxID=33920 RepID=UPI0028FD648E|nr:helix-turn-helix transcriptional regulator [Saccharothrix longispora]MDU0289545.1 helix-turn-helix transcriptional regulator [Saccharothrix longispora]